MAPMAMTLANDAALNNVIAYIQTLPDTPAPETIGGNAAAGAKTFEVCSYCHGAAGQGLYSMNAPRLTGMTDWYLKRQLEHFRDGVRGAHQKDYYGKQMGYMAQVFRDEQKINDVIAYIHTL
jgi:cytochrome c oxidase subunit 2